MLREICLLVLGLAGSGKSMFISEMVTASEKSPDNDRDSPPAPSKRPPQNPAEGPAIMDLGRSKCLPCISSSANITSDTREVEEYSLVKGGARVKLVDTPGFDNTIISDLDTLGKIVSWMKKSQTPIHGVIYFHRISDPRMTPAAVANLRVLRKLCGDGNLAAVALTSSFWSCGESELLCSREIKLQNGYWRDFLEGAKVIPYEDGSNKKFKVIEHFLNRDKPIVLDIQKELERRIEETSAGIEIQGLFGIEKRHLEAKIAELTQALDEKNKVISDLESQATKLQDSFATEMRELEGRIAELQNAGSEKDDTIFKLHEFITREGNAWREQEEQLKKSIKQKDEEIARLQGQQQQSRRRAAPTVLRQVGSDFGFSFRAYPTTDTPVKSIEVYHGNIIRIVHGIRVTWRNGERSKLYGARLGSLKTYEFAENERVEKMSIDALLEVHRIEFTTNMGGKFTAGGPTGIRNDVEVGNGLILGIEGRSELKITKLGVAFGDS